jgi:hypothetical protein
MRSSRITRAAGAAGLAMLLVAVVGGCLGSSHGSVAIEPTGADGCPADAPFNYTSSAWTSDARFCANNAPASSGGSAAPSVSSYVELITNLSPFVFEVKVSGPAAIQVYNPTPQPGDDATTAVNAVMNLLSQSNDVLVPPNGSATVTSTGGGSIGTTSSFNTVASGEGFVVDALAAYVDQLGKDPEDFEEQMSDCAKDATDVFSNIDSSNPPDWNSLITNVIEGTTSCVNAVNDMLTGAGESAAASAGDAAGDLADSSDVEGATSFWSDAADFLEIAAEYIPVVAGAAA